MSTSRDNTNDPTPWAVYCQGDGCGLIFLTKVQYDQQMSHPDATWHCTMCGGHAEWDDDCQETNPPEEEGLKDPS